MMVTFVAECEKKALNRSRRVLDAFADRIGVRTWQTVITKDGLGAVKKLLRRSATKNTAVACHWQRTRSRSDLVWIVGDRKKFNSEGIVPVNQGKSTMLNVYKDHDWHNLELIKALSSLAALFHDWGKASELFQAKLRPSKSKKVMGDPLRHEWISTLFLVAYINGQSDEQWLGRLSEGIFDDTFLIETAKKCEKKPLKGLPKVASLVAWLILSHHRLPLEDDRDNKSKWKDSSADSLEMCLKKITQKWGYENRFSEEEFQENLKRCFSYPNGLPHHSSKLLKQVQKHANELKLCISKLEESIEDGSWRLLLFHARLALMLGDHDYSSQDADCKWKSDLNLYANTDRKNNNQLKQKLDEHLVGVMKKAKSVIRLLPAFESKNDELPRAYDVKVLARKSPLKFRWQDTAVQKIKAWRKEQKKSSDQYQFGFFVINMASTGQGKTFANAKIMRALSHDEESLRYILALGLRTLTLQTGDEYQERIGLEKEDLAILIGSRAVLELHQKKKKNVEKNEEQLSGSESEESLFDSEVFYESVIPEDQFQTVLTKKKDRQFLFAPVLTCTIDHIIAATETKRGGKYILPSLRLMSSDLVIDEIDDFDGLDLIAIGRLIHLAGMLGRKVMISSATIPPDLAEGYFHAYQQGWAIFAKARQKNAKVSCAWVDEFTTQVMDFTGNQKSLQLVDDFEVTHQIFIEKRVQNLSKQKAKRKAHIVKLNYDEVLELNINQQYFQQVVDSVLEKHKEHYFADKTSGKNISFGVIRIANIKVCIELTKYLLQCQISDDYEVFCMPYHSQQILLMRSAQEQHLDQVLKRKNGYKDALSNSVIKGHLKECHKKNIIFVLVATPVEEVGRDHDFDWAIIEPSSYRSFIQLAGRVRRHRENEKEMTAKNIGILQYNFKAFMQKYSAKTHDEKYKAVFCRPGYEDDAEFLLESHDLFQLIDEEKIANNLDAIPRISKSKDLHPKLNFADLEHSVISSLLTNYNKKGPETMEGWISSAWWLTAMPQFYVRFRAGSKPLPLYYIPQGGEYKFAEKDEQGKPQVKEEIYGIRHYQLTEKEKKKLWLTRDYEKLLKEHEKKSLSITSLLYGEIGLPTYGKELNKLSFKYNPQLGLVQAKKEEI